MTKKELLDLYQQYRVIIIPIVVAISSVVLITLVILPQFSNLISSQKYYDEITHKSQTLEVKASELQNVNGNDLKNKVNIVLSFLPSEKDFPTIIGVMQQVAAENGFSLVSLQLGQATAGKTNGYTIRAGVVGLKSALSRLLFGIENASRVMKVTNLDFSSGSDDTVDVTINIDVFYASLPSNLGASEVSLPTLSSADEALINTLSSKIPASIISSDAITPVAKGKVNPFE